MENIYAIWTHGACAFLLPPSTEMKGLRSAESKLCLCLCPDSMPREISLCYLEDEHRREGDRKHLLVSKWVFSTQKCFAV